MLQTSIFHFGFRNGWSLVYGPGTIMFCDRIKIGGAISKSIIRGNQGADCQKGTSIVIVALSRMTFVKIRGIKIHGGLAQSLIFAHFWCNALTASASGSGIQE